MRMVVWFQVKHKCGHTSKMQGVHVDRFSEIKDEDMEAELARLESMSCRKCWIKENGHDKSGYGTWFVEIPKGL
jgi:hypothetical protein